MTFPRIAGPLIALAPLALPGAAGAVDSDWGPATQIDHSASTPVQAYGCASASQSTAVDDAGNAATFEWPAPGTEHRVALGAKLATGVTVVTLLCSTTTTSWPARSDGVAASHTRSTWAARGRPNRGNPRRTSHISRDKGTGA
jgi:hypothetical protein